MLLHLLTLPEDLAAHQPISFVLQASVWPIKFGGLLIAVPTWPEHKTKSQLPASITQKPVENSCLCERMRRGYYRQNTPKIVDSDNWRLIIMHFSLCVTHFLDRIDFYNVVQTSLASFKLRHAPPKWKHLSSTTLCKPFQLHGLHLSFHHILQKILRIIWISS